jgi:uncharacterized protein (DUF1697 family)
MTTAQPGHRFVALLRGINVGGKNIIKMADLKSCFASEGFEDVWTYIQSGNVIFSTAKGDAADPRERIEAMLSKSFGYEATVVLRRREEMRAIVDQAPAGFGADLDTYRYNVIFLMPPLTAKAAMESIETRDGVDESHPGPGVLYFSNLIERASQSRLSKLVSTPIYKRVTIRNWNTTTKLLSLLDGDRATT